MNKFKKYTYLPKLATVLTKVIVTLSDTSPSNKCVQILLAAPPGEQPMANKPNAKGASSLKARPRLNAI